MDPEEDHELGNNDDDSDHQPTTPRRCNTPANVPYRRRQLDPTQTATQPPSSGNNVVVGALHGEPLQEMIAAPHEAIGDTNREKATNPLESIEDDI